MNKEDKFSFLRAMLVFALTYTVVVVGAIVKYSAYGSFEEIGRDFYIAFAACAISALLVIAALFTYFIYSRHKIILNTKLLAAICTAIALSVTASIAISSLNLFYMPVALVAFILAPLVDRRDCFIANIVTNLLVSVVLLYESIMGEKVEITTVIVMLIESIFVGTLATYLLSGLTRRTNYVVRGVVVGVITVALSFLATQITQTVDFVPIVGFICLTAFAQPLVGMLLQPLFESVFNILTNTRLTELIDHNSPLIKMLITDALGTFNHSLSVAGFAEVCAMRIGENPYLARACAYYHDVGKLKNPTFFSENQSGYNPHDELLPEVSASILRAHANEGLDLCNQYRIPIEVSHVTTQHHGTLPMIVFYTKAMKLTDGEVDVKDYSYNGMTPVTKIAAIIMICDASEAALRAKGRPSQKEADDIVNAIINDRIARHQFDNCDITLRDLNIIRKTIVEQYSGVYHERVKYPDGKVKR